MGLDIWFREDVQRILKSKLSQALRHDDGSEYHRGYMAALEDIAIAFGLDEGVDRNFAPRRCLRQ